MNKTLEAAEKLAEKIDIESASVGFSLADLIEEGSTVSDKAEGWGEGDKQCAMHAAVTSMISRKMID